MHIDIIGVFGISLVFALLVALKMASVKQARERKELADHKRWMTNHEAYELNRSTKWHG